MNSPIKINYDREMIEENHEKLITLPVTVERLASMVGDSPFWIHQYWDGPFSEETLVLWTTSRPETDEEQKARIASAERYMENYHKFQNRERK